ncbi:MAG: hypothetical protein JRJ84_02245 [Deltaproteobacteria bacterium]|nr:hypothetical protein [Deltaproteobacteria bacterium]
MWFALLAGWLAAFAVSPEELETRLAEVESLRSLRVATGAPSLSSADIRRAATGGVVAGLVGGTSPPLAYGAAVLDVPIATLWSALNDETRQPGFTAVGYAELIKGRPCVNGRRVLQSIQVPMIGARWWIGVPKANRDLLVYSGGAVRELTFRSSVDPAEITSASGQQIIDAATPIGSSKGGWFLVAVDQRHTFVEYHISSDPGGRVSPRFASMFATKGVRNGIRSITRFAKEGNPSCPIE